MSPASPANWPSDRILAFPGEVRVELAGKNKDQGGASPSSSDIAALEALVAKPWVDLREALEAAAAGERQIPSGLDVLQDNLKSGTQPDMIELAKRKIIRAGLFSPMCLLVEIIRAVVAERILPDEPPPSTGKTS
jgi:plasmid stabilization system protein ParE